MGLVILAVVTGLTAGQPLTVFGVVTTAAIAFGFLQTAGRPSRRPAFRPGGESDRSAWHPDHARSHGGLRSGVARVSRRVGDDYWCVRQASFSATRPTPMRLSVGSHLSAFFVPLFFVTVGAAVDVGVLNPLEPGNRSTLLMGGLLILVAVLGKFLAGYAPVCSKARRTSSAWA